jgi:opacity protein-like surface antigen
MSRKVIVAVAAVVVSAPLAARAAYDPNLHVDPSVDDCSVRFAPELTQGAFHTFAREFGSVSAFKQGAPPETLGAWRVALDVEQLYFSVDEKSAAWNDTFTHPDSSHELGASKAFPKLRLRVGVTDDLELGAYYTENLEANYGWLGVDAKYALLHQRDGAPVSLAVRAAYTKTLYVADMNMHAVTADVSVGRTLWNVLTPYVGLGGDTVLVRETSPAVDLEDEAIFVPRLTAGVEARWWHLGVGAEAHVAALTSYQLQVSAVF